MLYMTKDDEPVCLLGWRSVRWERQAPLVLFKTALEAMQVERLANIQSLVEVVEIHKEEDPSISEVKCFQR